MRFEAFNHCTIGSGVETPSRAVDAPVNGHGRARGDDLDNDVLHASRRGGLEAKDRRFSPLRPKLVRFLRRFFEGDFCGHCLFEQQPRND